MSKETSLIIVLLIVIQIVINFAIAIKETKTIERQAVERGYAEYVDGKFQWKEVQVQEGGR